MSMTHSAVVRESDGDPQAVAFDAWRRSVDDEFVRLSYEPADAGDFRGSMRASEIGDLLLANLWHEAIRVSRTSHQARYDAEHFYKISMQLDGYSVIAQDGRESVLAPGDFAVYTTERPFTFTTHGASRALIIVVPTPALQIPGRLKDRITAVRVSGSTGLGAVASKYVIDLEAGIRQNAIRPSRALADSVISVLRSTLVNELGSALDAADEGLDVTILGYIEGRLGDPEFTQEEVARAHHISVRQLQRIFQEQGTTFSQWVQSRRLEQCRRELESSQHTGVHDIAFAWGIQDASYFSRLFKQRYGMTPTEYRLEHTTAAPPALSR